MDAMETRHNHSVWENPIIVVHNRTDVSDLATLQSRIEEVGTCYESTKSLDHEWNTLVPDCIYQTRFSLHVFLVSHKGNGIAQNLKTVELLRSYLIEETSPLPHALVPKIVESVTKELPYLLKAPPVGSSDIKITSDTRHYMSSYRLASPCEDTR